MITYLAWDSDFFKKKIGRISLSASTILEEKLAEGKTQGYDLIYVFSENEIDEKYQDKLVDIKVIFEKILAETPSVCGTQNENPLVCGTQNINNIENLYHLAYISGEFSRFKKDKKLGEEAFQRLYQEWVNNSVNHQIADHVLVYEKDSKILGMVTLKLHPENSVIGLIAVDNSAQGMGIGQQLMAECERISIENNIKTIEVATQEFNQKAYQFYQKCGFVAKSRQFVYHFWL